MWGKYGGRALFDRKTIRFAAVRDKKSLARHSGNAFDGMPVAEQLSDPLYLDCRKHFDGKKYLNLSILMAVTTLHVPSRSTGVNSCRFGGSYSVTQQISVCPNSRPSGLMTRPSHLTKAAPIIHGMAFIPAPQPDCKLTYLSDKQFAKVLDFLNQPAPTDVQ